MASSTNNLVEELLKSINSTTSLIQGLINEIKDNATTLATLETKLNTLNENSKTLSKIVRDDNGNKSVLTRIALLENDLSDLNTNYKEFKSYVYKKTDELVRLNNEIIKLSETDEEVTGKRKWIMASLQIAPGVIALILVLIKLFWGVEVGI